MVCGLGLPASVSPSLIEYFLQITPMEGARRGDEQQQEAFIVPTSLACQPIIPCTPSAAWSTRRSSHVRGCLHGRAWPPVDRPPEYCLRTQLIQILYAIPSERRRVEELEYNLLLRWFVGLPLSRPVFHATSFTKNRRRLRRSASRPKRASYCPASTSLGAGSS